MNKMEMEKGRRAWRNDLWLHLFCEHNEIRFTCFYRYTLFFLSLCVDLHTFIFFFGEFELYLMELIVLSFV